jgi:predicted transcriptional regulator
MRTTLNIDDDVLRAVRELARLRGNTAGGILSELAREALERERPEAAGVRNGVPLLPARPGAGIVTPEGVRALRRDA